MLIKTSTSNYNNATYSICNTALIFESFGDPNPITNIGCGDQSQAWSFYREVPPSISASRTFRSLASSNIPYPYLTNPSVCYGLA